MREITALGRGVVIYLRPGDHSTLSALQNHDAGLAHVGLPGREACEPADDRGLSVHILRDLGVSTVQHVYNPPSLHAALSGLAPSMNEMALMPGEVA
jgi:GTP cyclohydrolase II